MSLRASYLAAMLMLAASADAHGAWSVVASNADYFVEFDPDLVRAQGPYVMAWTRLTFTVPQQGGDAARAKYQSQLQLHAIDCAAKASTVVGLVVFSGALGRGEEIERTMRPRAQWTPKPAPPGTLSDVTVRLACKSRAESR